MIRHYIQKAEGFLDDISTIIELCSVGNVKEIKKELRDIQKEFVSYSASLKLLNQIKDVVEKTITLVEIAHKAKREKVDFNKEYEVSAKNALGECRSALLRCEWNTPDELSMGEDCRIYQSFEDFYDELIIGPERYPDRYVSFTLPDTPQTQQKALFYLLEDMKWI